MAPGPLQFGLMQADPAWRSIDLLSDVHLNADQPGTFAAWREHLLGTPADAVLMLGDLFEVWVGDDARGGGFEAECLAVLQAASRRRMLAFMPGNRDFLVGDELLTLAGVHRLRDPSVLQAFGARWLLTHGDALCLADTDYQRFRAQVQDSAFQARFMAQPLGERLRQARALRDASTMHQATRPPESVGDVDDDAAADWLRQADAPVMVHGHTHRPALHALPGGRTRFVLGDWDFDTTPSRARALRLSAEGLAVLDLANGAAP